MVPVIKIDEHIVIRPVEESDIQKRMVYGSPDQFRIMSGGSKVASEFTLEKAQKFYDRIYYSTYGWVIDYDGEMIGLVRINKRDNGRHRFAIGILDESKLSKGIGTKVTLAATDYAFEMGADLIELMVLDYNKRAIRCYEKCGFVIEEVLKDNHEMDGEFFDDIIMIKRKTS